MAPFPTYKKITNIMNRVKHRSAKKTILLVGEGTTEKAFLQHIKELYVGRYADVSVAIEHADGGSPDYIVHRAICLFNSRTYDECFVLIDGDKLLKTKKSQILVLNSTPCIEGLFLAIDKANFFL
jgi:hypothetical protein